MQAQWKGFYLDGRTAARRTASVQAARTGLSITIDDGRILWWPYGEIRQAQGAYAGEPIRLERQPAEVLVLEDIAFLSAVHQIAPDAPFHNPATRRRRVLLTVLALGLLCGVLAASYVWLLPALASRLAEHVPIAWEERLGEAVMNQLAPPGMRCSGQAGQHALEAMLARLTTAVPESPYTFRIVVVDSPIVNALAAPGARIVVFRGLLAATRAPEELAGVLAHEMAHTLRHHPTRAIIQQASTGLVIAALTGAARGALAYSLEAARTLAMLQYSRDFEEEADQEGARILLAAGISPAGLIRFLEATQKAEGPRAALPRYLSTHPDTPSRILRLQKLAGEMPPDSPVLAPAAWRQVQRICPGASGSRPAGRD